MSIWIMTYLSNTYIKVPLGYAFLVCDSEPVLVNSKISTIVSRDKKKLDHPAGCYKDNNFANFAFHDVHILNVKII